MFGGALGRNKIPPTISAAWSDVADVFGPGGATNEDRTITFGGGSRTITATAPPSGTLEYRIDSGSWTTYTAGFAFTHNHTLAWQFTGTENLVPTAVPVRVNGVVLDTFNVSATGWP